MNSFKDIGNNFFLKKEYNLALENYLKGLDETNEKINLLTNDDTEESSTEEELKNLNIDKSVFNSNICAAYCSLEQYGLAMEFGVECTKLRPEWYKTWYRLSIVLNKLKKYDQAKTTIAKSIECLENETIVNNETMDTLISLQKDINKNMSKNTFDFSKFKDGDIPLDDSMKPLLGEMMNNKDIQEMMSNPEFKEKIMKNKGNPMALLGDPEIMDLVAQMASKLNINK
jgi:tetratricopeptide (TPR) repeat protein